MRYACNVHTTELNIYTTTVIVYVETFLQTIYMASFFESKLGMHPHIVIIIIVIVQNGCL